jgi:hypothetical protein
VNLNLEVNYLEVNYLEVNYLEVNYLEVNFRGEFKIDNGPQPTRQTRD